MIVNPGIRRFLGSAIQRLFNSASFYAPLTHTLVPERGTGSTTFTRATTKTINNNDGYLVTLLAGEIGFPGARRVHNIISQDSEDISGWSLIGTASALGNVLSMPADGDGIFVDGLTYSSVLTSRTFVMKVEMSGTGTIAIQLAGNSGGNGSGYENVTLSATPTWFELAHTFPTTVAIYPQIVIRRNGTTATSVTIDSAQLEDVTAQTTQTAGEYVSVGVESAPYYHGSMVDGVKCFGTDLSGNPLPTAYTYDAVSLNGVAGTYVSTPDSVAASITGDIDIRVKAALTDWTPAANTVLLAKRNGTGEYYLAVLTNGTLDFEWWDSGGVNRNSVSTVATGLTDGVTKYVRVTLDIDNGAGGNDVKFYLSDDGAAWIQLGATVTQAFTTSIRDTTDTIDVGSQLGGAASNLSGRIYQAQIYNGINGTLAVDFDASRYAGGTTLTGSTGETWTLNGTAVIHPTNTPMTRYKPEPAATNLCTYSNGFASWTATSGGTGIAPVVTPNYAVGPDGAMSATRLVLDKGAGGTLADIATIYANNIAGLSNPHASALSIWSKMTSGGSALVSFSSGQVAGAGVLVTDAWQRIECNYASIASGLDRFDIALRGTYGTSDSADILIAFAQLELGSTATSYIPTTTVAVARNADVLTYSGGNIPNLDAAGWVYAQVTANNTGATTQADVLTNGSDFALYSRNDLGKMRFFNGTTDVNVGDLSLPYSNKKLAWSWTDAVSVSGAVDGTVATAALSGNLSIGNTLRIGGGVGLPLDGNIGPLAFGLRRLSDSELQAITA